jgi:1-deoxyxylulose-5-phosphate synthase
MQYVNLGRTGLKVSRICLGCMTYGSPRWREWVLAEQASRPFIKRALDLYSLISPTPTIRRATT